MAWHTAITLSTQALESKEPELRFVGLGTELQSVGDRGQVQPLSVWLQPEAIPDLNTPAITGYGWRN